VTKDLATVLDPSKLEARNDGMPRYSNEALNRKDTPIQHWKLKPSGNAGFAALQFSCAVIKVKTPQQLCKTIIQCDNFPAFAKLAAISLTFPF